VARDPGTFKLVGEIHPGLKRLLAHDAIFLPGFEEAASSLSSQETARLDGLFETGGRPVIGLNIRQWFHFSSSLLPYQFSRSKYLSRSEEKMGQIIDASERLVFQLRKELDARVLLISAYQPGIVEWEDDLPWLRRIKDRFAEDPEVVLTDLEMSLPAYYAMMSRLSLMIGMRLHSTLIAVRYGVPSLNVSYTLKGGAILSHLGLPDNVITLDDFLTSPGTVFERASALMNNLPAEREKTRAAVERAVEINRRTLSELFSIDNDS
jgi:polysaccharide pyruvyl transferase WcaK-like protein